MQSRATRRGFLKSTLATGTGLLIFDHRLAFGYQANDRLNIASIGVAGMGRGNLGNVSTENIVALCDVHESRAADAYKKQAVTCTGSIARAGHCRAAKPQWRVRVAGGKG